MLKGLPLAYNKDMQEDKEALFDALDTVKNCLAIFRPMLATIKVKESNMLNAARGGFTNATDLADYLVRKGVPFRDAHTVAGKAVIFCIDAGKSLDELSLEEFRGFSPLIEQDVYNAISLHRCVEARKVLSGPSPSSVRSAIERSGIKGKG
jgi:argininosuccinate lyase